MLEIKGTTDEITDAVKAIAPTFPTQIIPHLWPGEYHFTLNGVDTKVVVTK